MKTRRIRRDRMRSNQRLSDGSFQRELSAFLKALQRVAQKLGSGPFATTGASTVSAAELECVLHS
jgi:hypothetical protein